MAYPKYCEGNKPVTYALNTPITFEDKNEEGNQIAGMTGPRDLLHFPAGYEMAGAAGWILDNSFDYLEATTANGAVWFVPIQVYAGQKITEVEVQVTGANGSLGGALWLIEAQRGGTTISSQQIDPGGNIYHCAGGTAYGNVITYTKTIADPGLPMTCLADHYYYMWLQAGTNAATHDCRIWWYHVTAQFGN
jgi:hypothetical protein